MTTKRGRGSEDMTPPGADDFERIYRIGATIKNRLYAAGILTFKQLAELSPDQLAARVGDFPGKSAELLQEWINQARALASQPPDAAPQISTTAEPLEEINSAIRLHAERFRVELLLRADNTVHHILVTHYESEEKATLVSWKEAVDFIVTHAALRLPPAEPAPAIVTPMPPIPAEPAPLEPAPAPPVPAEPALVEPAPIPVEPAPVELVPAPPVPAEPALVEPAPTVVVPAPPIPVEPAPQPAVTTGLVGARQLRALEVMLAGDNTPSRVLRHDHPFGVRLTFDLAELAAIGQAPLDYTATIYARSVSGRSHQILGEARGIIAPDDTVIVNLEGKTLPPGIYRLEATVALTPSSTVPAHPLPAAMIESGMLQVY